MLLVKPLRSRKWLTLLVVACLAAAALAVPSGPYPARLLPAGKTVVTDQSPEMLKMPASARGSLTGNYTIAKAPPEVDFMVYPGQNHIGNPWSDWGDGTAVGEKHYSAIGDHKWESYVYEYDSKTKKLRTLVNVKKFLNLPAGHYTPGKIHSMVTMGKDGWLYYSTHRGSSKYTDGPGRQQYHYRGDWVLRTNPETNKTEIVKHAPIPYEAIPAGRVDAERLIFYGGTANDAIFFALDCKTGEVLARSEPKKGLYRYCFISKTTGRCYFQPQTKTAAPIYSYDPKTNKIQQVPGVQIGLRAATDELPGGVVYTCDHGGGLYKFDVNTEKGRRIGSLSISQHDSYHGSLDASPDGRYLYCLGGAHGGIAFDGTPVKQYDTKTGKVKILCFLAPYYTKKYNYIPDGTFGTALSPDGSKLYITMNGCKPIQPRTFKGVKGAKGDYGASAWYVCALFVIHIPESERMP